MLSILSYFAVFMILNSMPILPEFNTAAMLFSDPISYLLMFFFLISYVTVDAGLRFANT